MEKLIKLLNEYSKLKEERYLGEEGKPIRTRKEYELEYPIERIRIISKPYGFIKRLVKNKKINFSIIPNKIKEIGIPMKINGEIKYGFDSSDYYWLLMLLSIQDNPIEFLVSILK